MITLKLQGGLGNQMFIYAFAKTLEQMGYEVCLDASIYNFYRQKEHSINSSDEMGGGVKYKKHMSIRKLELLDFNLSLPIINSSDKWAQNDKMTPIHLKILGKTKKIIMERIKRYKTFSEQDVVKNNQIIIPARKNIILDGYFCDANYFSHIQEILQKDFTLQKPLSIKNKQIKETIQQTQNSCFLHIRRGDYLAPHNWMFVKLGKTYYEEAIRLVCKNTKNPTFFIFSNDIQWCKDTFLNLLSQEIVQNNRFVFIDNNSEGDASEELELMKSCQNGIVANSTFSWWGAFLQRNPNKTIIIPNQLVYYEYNDKKSIPHQTKKTKSDRWISLDWCWGTVQNILS